MLAFSLAGELIRSRSYVKLPLFEVLGSRDRERLSNKSDGREACIAATKIFNFEIARWLEAGQERSVREITWYIDHSMKSGIYAFYGAFRAVTQVPSRCLWVAVNACGDVYEPNSSKHVSGFMILKPKLFGIQTTPCSNERNSSA